MWILFNRIQRCAIFFWSVPSGRFSIFKLFVFKQSKKEIVHSRSIGRTWIFVYCMIALLRIVRTWALRIFLGSFHPSFPRRPKAPNKSASMTGEACRHYIIFGRRSALTKIDGVVVVIDLFGGPFLFSFSRCLFPFSRIWPIVADSFYAYVIQTHVF